MDEASNVLIKLQDMSQFIERGTLGQRLMQQAETTARLVDAESCSIMLINDGDGEDLRMSVRAVFGPHAPAALNASVGKGDGIAGHVLATGRSLLVADILASRFAPMARRADDPRRSLMLAPISIDGKIVGMVNVCARHGGGAFAEIDLHLLDVISLFIGKSVQVVQLQTLLDSRFAQLAMLHEVQERVAGTVALTAYRNPDQVARILAKSLFKEMTRAGFDSGQIIGAASEIIDQLNANLHRHSKRAARGDGKPD